MRLRKPHFFMKKMKDFRDISRIFKENSNVYDRKSHYWGNQNAISQ